MWLVLASYTCRKISDFLSCLSDDVSCKCISLLEPLVCSFAELDHVVVESELILTLECLLWVDCVAVHLVLSTVNLAVYDDAVLVYNYCCNCC